HDVELAAGQGVAVDRASEIVDEFDDDFRQEVGWRGLAGEEKGARRNGQARVLPQALIENDDPQRVEQLPLVFVNALDLAIERRVRVDAGLRLRLEPVAEPRLGGA